MVRTGPEHRSGWHARFEMDGVPVEIHARHHVRRRMPRGHEISRQAMRGTPFAMVEETDHSWSVSARGRAALTLRQHPSGDFHSGGLSFPRMDIRDAAEAALRRLARGLIPAAPAPCATADGHPEEDAGSTPRGP